MRVLLTGAAGFIGARAGVALADAGHEVVAVDAMLAAAHGPDAELPAGVRRVDVRDAAALAPLLKGVDVVCHQAAMVGAGVDAADAPSYGSHNDFATAVLLAEMFAAGCRRLVLASSMVVYGQGRYDCAEHGPSIRCRAREDLDAGVFEHRCPIGGEPVRWGLVGEDAPLRPRSLYAASKTAQEHYALAWAESSEARSWRCAITTSTARGCPATRRIPGSPPSSAPRSKKATAKGFRGRRADARLRPRRRRRSGQCRGRRRRSWRLPASNVCSGRPISIWRWPGCVRPAAGRCRWSPVSTAAATSATSSPTPRGCRGAGFHRGGRPGRRVARVRVRTAARLDACAARGGGRYRHARGVGSDCVDVVAAAAADLLPVAGAGAFGCGGVADRARRRSRHRGRNPVGGVVFPRGAEALYWCATATEATVRSVLRWLLR